MAKSAKKEPQAKKGSAKRPAVSRVKPAHPWDVLDVSAWLDTSMLIDEETGQCCDSCPSEQGFYLEVPAEANMSWWAAVHPDQKQEVRAARLAASLELARREAEKESTPEASAHYEKMRDEVLLELRELADKEDVVTADAALGKWYSLGRNLDKNDEEAAKHLLKAAEAGDPYSAFLLAHAGYCPERTEELFKKSLEGGCPSAFIEQGYNYIAGRSLPADELETLALRLAAFAAKKVYRCLSRLVDILHEPASAGFRIVFAAAVLVLLRQAAEADVDEACEHLGEVLLRGVLCRRDAGKAKELYRKAAQKGSGSAVLRYAFFLLDEAQSLPKEEKAAQRQEAFALLREKGMKDDKLRTASLALLARYLTSSDDDKEFAEGLDCLDKCLDECSAKDQSDPSHGAAAGCIELILKEHASPQRRARALKFLDRMVRAGIAQGMRLKGVCCLMGMCGKDAGEQGLKLLLEAGQKGAREAWSTLAGIYALGLYGCRVNIKKALTMAIEGDKAGSEDAHIWRIFLELGEFSKASKSIAGLIRPPKTSAQDLGGLIERNDGVLMNIMGRMIWLDATDLRAKAAPFASLPEKPHPAYSFDELIHDAVLFSQLIVAALQNGNVATAAFAVHSLKKISKTEYGQFYMGALAVRLGMSYASDAKVFQFLKEYFQGLPESMYRFMGKEEDPELEEKMKAWAAYMRLFNNPDFYDDEDEDYDDDYD